MSWNLSQLQSEMTARILGIREEYRGVMVACSGGLDSTVLFDLFYQLLKENKYFELGLIHVNYKLRGEESKLDQAFVEDLAKRYGVPLHVREVSASELAEVEGQGGVQVWARRIRREVFQDFHKQGYVIALAHHEGDISENTLLRLTRGSGIGALAGMKEYTAPYWRPLLKVGKNDLLKYAEKHGIPYRTDSSNAKIIYSRNLIRHKVLPELERLYPKASKRIAEAAIEAQELAQYCREKLQEELDSHGLLVPASFLTDKPKGLAFAALSLMLSRVGRPGKQYSRQLFGLILVKLQEKGPKKQWRFNVAGGLIFFFDDGFIRIEPEPLLRKIIGPEKVSSPYVT